ncbi:tRNA nucleotidyltransferase (CCA-adding enzyme) [Polynucleobacter sphagniphilus]|jgi:tRNA nucleotidyltransferase (CCA-adding enzyme)|uniref:tRNA nucleotidyltransferase (CCA-adding enzyme) n=1 Tax=Polynucleobacter sphagniphilus TaxID=1743169 RepID=A0AA43M608_9BURK|nr:tRNA nucleotidyltransferase (CCA-adding enzyme) [Polynucleobacter sphagniphilus]MDH6241655.1 tRNA nucleotidyltransferase (CCA-adding enzyme) [Polynucleobacter sphagniphilus]MDH6248913.1 tRNA nucleotidyltransferase (CCA-adding enzyme) [Polynucleobacter sphagniphilus]MDH6299579.1 tRNA nucleotidyltransferase (CCA-adding enzyme) [Polynucleobacter sphagniphilus]MDH6301458.1 tRNA nucleotidyltransferase (CCA-adding enzyme) [Polynucleobacter sphagniphilus]
MKIYAVGGAIRDTQMGLPMHDIDYVVVGSSVEEMLAKGFRPVGKDFPVFLHPQTQAEYALARTERKTGLGYKGFLFHADPSVTLEQDLERRDLTMNAMAQEVSESGALVGPIIDPFNGQRDLVAKVFRHVSDAFAEDPLRLLRIARFAARFPQFTVAPETLEALKAIVQSGELNALSPERIWQELARGLIADKPMRMFQVLLDTAAAQTILPASLVAQLVQEPAREIMGAHLHASAAVLEQRCAVALMNLPATEIRSWAECIRMPIEVRDFSEIFSELIQFLKMSLGGVFQAIDVLAWFNRADVWRKPERGNKLLQLARKLGFKVDSLILAMQQAQLLNAPEIIATIPLEDKLNGERIRSAVEAARLATITSALNLNN